MITRDEYLYKMLELEYDSGDRRLISEAKAELVTLTSRGIATVQKKYNVKVNNSGFILKQETESGICLTNQIKILLNLYLKAGSKDFSSLSNFHCKYRSGDQAHFSDLQTKIESEKNKNPGMYIKYSKLFIKLKTMLDSTNVAFSDTSY